MLFRSRILGFEEKPLHPKGSLANAGIYVARRELLDLIPVPTEPGGVVDFGLHVFPRLDGQLFGYPLDGVLIDIGTPAGLERASTAWARMKSHPGARTEH